MSGPFCTVNGAPAVRGNIARPRLGVWHADLTIDSQDASRFSGAVTISIGDGSVTLQGTSYRSGVHHDTVFVRCVGGAGGLGTVLGPKSYRGVPLRIPVQDVLSAAGETLSPICDSTILSTALPFWSRQKGSASTALAALLVAAGSPAWRILSDGSLWIGTESWPEVSLTYDEIEFEPQQGRLEIACDAPTISPGQTFIEDSASHNSGKHRVSYVEHQISAETIRHILLFEGETPGDRMKQAIDSYVRGLFPRLDFMAGYWAKVVGQNADRSLELVPDDPRLDTLSGVPVRYGVPGITAKVSPGARALVEFSAGDPSRPMVTAWEPGTALELDLNATTIVLNGGSAKVARVGDAVAAGTTMATWVAGVQALLNGSGAASKGPLVAPTDFGLVNAGAPGVKA